MKFDFNHRIILSALVLSVGVFALFFSAGPIAWAQAPLHRHVLVLHSYNQDMSWVRNIDRAIDDVLRPDESGLVVHRENLDTKRNFNPAYLDQFRQLLAVKYKDTPFDLIISSDNNAFEFLRSHHASLFPNVPVVFCGVNDFSPDLISVFPDFTGVAEIFSDVETIETMLALHPGTNKILIINDFTPTGQAWTHSIQHNIAAAKQTDRVDIQFSPNVSMSKLQDQLRALDENTLVLLGAYFKDQAGDYFTYEKIGDLISMSSSRPVYALLNFNITANVVGGKVIGGYYQGQAAAEIGRKILTGTAPNAIPVMTQDSNHFVFNWPQLQKWGIPPDALPDNSLIINHPPTFYEKNKTAVWGVVVFFVLLAALSMMLFNRKLQKQILLRQKIENTLRASEEKYRALFESSAVGIALCKMDGSLTEVNQGFLDIVQYDFDEIRKLTYWELTPKDYEQQEQEQLKSLNATGTYGPYEKHYIRKDGTWVPVSLNGSLVTESTGERVIWSVVHDISTRKRAEQELHDALDTAKLANQAKSEFLANMSHELRTPLNSIIGFSEMMKYEIKGPLPPVYQEYTTLISTSGHLLLETINSILDIAKIEAGKFELQKEPVYMGDIVDEVIALLEIQAHQKGLSLSNNTQNLHHMFVDPMRIKQVLINLIGNAIKFTDTGHVSIESRCNEEGHNILVVDSGIGMTPKQVEIALEPFSQVHGTSLARRFQGTGLGLSLSNKIMELHEGELQISSTLNEGTTVTLHFPPHAHIH